MDHGFQKGEKEARAEAENRKMVEANLRLVILDRLKDIHEPAACEFLDLITRRSNIGVDEAVVTSSNIAAATRSRPTRLWWEVRQVR